MTTTKPKLLLTAIFKDDTEYEMIERMLQSFMPYYDGLAVAITGLGATSKIEGLVKNYKGEFVKTSPKTHPKIYSQLDGKWIFSSFAAARNVSFDLASKMQEKENYDYWSWADADDVLIGGQELSAVASRAKELKVDSVFFTYWYSVILDKNGDIKDIAIEHLRERLLRPDTFKWVSRLHEVAVPKDDKFQPKNSAYDFNEKEERHCVWAHITTDNRVTDAMRRNIDLLNIQVKEENRTDPRTIMYLAKTHYDLKTPPDMFEAEKLFHEYLSGPHPSGWDEERSNAWEYLGNIYGVWGDHEKAEAAYMEGLREYPRLMHILNLAKENMAQNKDAQADFWLELALRADMPKASTTIGNPILMKIMAVSLKYNQAMKKTNIEEAYKWLKIRNELTNGENKDMLKVLEDAMSMNNAAKNVFNYAKWLKDTGNEDKVADLLKSLPSDLGREQFAFYLANQVNKPKTWGKDEIVYYASWGAEHFEGWSAKSLKKGIGGSESAVIELAKRWAKKGYKVTVFGDPREDAGEIDGVTYRPWYEINWKDKFNILILWRSPHLVDLDIKANKLFYDAHDVESQLNWSQERMDKVDKFFFKSKFHRSMVPKIPDEKAKVIGNGI